MASSDPASTASAASAVALSVVVGPGGGSWRWVVEGLVVRGPSFFLDFLPIIYCFEFSPTTACVSRAPTVLARARRACRFEGITSDHSGRGYQSRGDTHRHFLIERQAGVFQAWKRPGGTTMAMPLDCQLIIFTARAAAEAKRA